MAIIDRGSLFAGDRGIFYAICIRELGAVIAGYALKYLAEITSTDFSLDHIDRIDGTCRRLILGDKYELHSRFPFRYGKDSLSSFLSSYYAIKLPMTEGDPFLNLFRSFFYAMLQILELF